MSIASLLRRGGRGGRDNVGTSTRVALRLVLYEGEAYRLPRSCPGVRVVDGETWISFAGKDTVLRCGEELQLKSGRDFAVVSTLGRSALVLEVLARGRARSALRRPRLRRAAACEG